MSNLTNFWNIPANEQQTVTTEIKEQTKAQEPATIPTQCTLKNALSTDCEFAVCACMLFIIIVQDRSDLGGGYGVTVTALGQIHTEFFEDPLIDLETVETYIEANAPYTAHTPVWVPLPVYHTRKNETEYLNKLWKDNPATVHAFEGKRCLPNTCANCKNEMLTQPPKRRKIKGQWKKFCDHCVKLVDADRAKYQQG